MCLNLKQYDFKTGELGTSKIRKDNKNKRNKYVSFNYQMNRHGAHEMVVHVRCIGQSRLIQLDKNGLTFKITNYNRDGSAGNRCLEVHTRIESAFPQGECSEFYLVFQALGVDRSMCVRNIAFHSNCGELISRSFGHLMQSLCTMLLQAKFTTKTEAHLSSL